MSGECTITITARTGRERPRVLVTYRRRSPGAPWQIDHRSYLGRGRPVGTLLRAPFVSSARRADVSAVGALRLRYVVLSMVLDGAEAAGVHSLDVDVLRRADGRFGAAITALGALDGPARSDGAAALNDAIRNFVLISQC